MPHMCLELSWHTFGGQSLHRDSFQEVKSTCHITKDVLRTLPELQRSGLLQPHGVPLQTEQLLPKRTDPPDSQIVEGRHNVRTINTWVSSCVQVVRNGNFDRAPLFTDEDTSMCTKSDTVTAGSDRAEDLVGNDKSVFTFNTVVTNSCEQCYART